MCCRASDGEGDIASGAQPGENMGKKRVMDLDLMPNRLGLSVVYKQDCWSVSQQQWMVLTVQETGTEICRKCMW